MHERPTWSHVSFRGRRRMQWCSSLHRCSISSLLACFTWLGLRFGSGLGFVWVVNSTPNGNQTIHLIKRDGAKEPAAVAFKREIGENMKRLTLP